MSQDAIGGHEESAKHLISKKNSKMTREWVWADPVQQMSLNGTETPAKSGVSKGGKARDGAKLGQR